MDSLTMIKELQEINSKGLTLSEQGMHIRETVNRRGKKDLV